MFPGAGAQVDYNEAGEPTGWDYPSDDPMDYYCDMCGSCHAGQCTYDPYDNDGEPFEEDLDEEDKAFEEVMRDNEAREAGDR